MDASDNSNTKITPKPAFQSPVDIVIWVIIAIQLIVAVYGFAVLPGRCRFTGEPMVSRMGTAQSG